MRGLQDLKHFVVVSVAVTLALLVIGLWGVNRFYFQPREMARQATAMAQATAGAESLQMTGTAQAVAGSVALAQTATVQEVMQNVNGTATAQAVAAIATVEAGTATAVAQSQAATATAEALALRCYVQANYGMAIDPEPELRPAPGATRVTFAKAFDLVATWTVTNAGACAWEYVAFNPVSGAAEAGDAIRVLVGEEPLVVEADGRLAQPVAPGQMVQLELHLRRDPREEVEGVWLLRANGLSLADLPRFELAVRDWVVPVTPTPTSTPTSTPTPTPRPPTSTPRPPDPPPPRDTPKPGRP